MAGEYADAIREHLPEIIGIVAAFLYAEGLSAFLAATPTGVGQLAAAVIQLGLGAYGIKAMASSVKGYTIDRGSNLIDMPSLPQQTGRGVIHRGSHPEYDRFVIKELDEIRNRLTRRGAKTLEEVEPTLLDDALRKLEEKLRKHIETEDLPPSMLKELQERDKSLGRKLGLNDSKRGDVSA